MARSSSDGREQTLQSTPPPPGRKQKLLLALACSVPWKSFWSGGAKWITGPRQANRQPSPTQARPQRLQQPRGSSSNNNSYIHSHPAQRGLTGGEGMQLKAILLGQGPIPQATCHSMAAVWVLGVPAKTWHCCRTVFWRKSRTPTLNLRMWILHQVMRFKIYRDILVFNVTHENCLLTTLTA